MPAPVMRAALGLAVVMSIHPVYADDMGYVAFTSPSGNILCGIFEGDFPGARCDMSSLTPSYTRRPADCDLEWGSSFFIGSGEAKGEVACVGDIVANPEDATVLPYGRSVNLAGITCRSEKTGVTCTNASGHGFTLSKAKQRLY